MNYFQSFILGVIEGLTEFLPISSTAHLIIVSNWLKINPDNFVKFFQVFIQSGAILAVIFAYFDYIKKKPLIIKKLIFSFIPTALGSVFLYNTIKNIFFENFLLIASSLIFLGVVFIVLESIIKKNILKLKFDLQSLTYLQAIIIGLIQLFSVIPGISRAGAVIVGMMALGFRRQDSVLYSFLLAVPTIVSASIFDLYKTLPKLDFTYNQIISIIIGFTTSFIFALISIRWFLKYLKENDLTFFGIYRIVLGLIILSLFFRR